MKRTIAALGLLLASCTSYRDAVRAYWPAPDVAVVKASVSRFGYDPEAFGEYLILQAAEQALGYGFKYFVMLDTRDTSTSTTSYLNSPKTTTFSGTSSGGFFSGTATTTGGVQPVTVVHPGAEVAFRMFTEKPAEYQQGQYYDARYVYSFYGPKHLGDAFKPLP